MYLIFYLLYTCLYQSVYYSNIDAPSKEPCHPDFAPSQGSSSAFLTKQSFARLFRAQTRSKRSSLKMNVANMCNLKYPVLRNRNVM